MGAPKPVIPVTPVAASEMPALGKPAKYGKGVLKYEIDLPRDKPTNHVWVYLPDPMPKTKLPVILIAPPGTPLFLGNVMAPADEATHVPFALAGFAVLAYELDGYPGPERHSIREVLVEAHEFKESKAGLRNEQDALNFALAKVPNLDKERIYMVGHSSAGAHALLMTSQDPRIKACVAFAPVSEIANRMNQKTIAELENYIKGYRNFIKWESPDSHLSELKCPVFIFQAKDDPIVSVSMNEDFAKKLSKANKQVTLQLVEKGGHFDPMIQQGIPAAIKWLKGMGAKH